MIIDVIAGTRPNYVKIGALFSAIKRIKSKHQFRFINTGQHYDKLMSSFFFKSFSLPQPYYNMKFSYNYKNNLSYIYDNYFNFLKKDPPNLCIVVGDVTSTIACALAAKHNNIKVAHIEAGLRSNDMSMPEEINRKITDSISDIFFTTTTSANRNLMRENIKKNIFLVGNIMIDSLKIKLNQIKKNKKKFFFKKYLVITLHRQSNVRDTKKLIEFLDAFVEISKIYNLQYVAHPYVLRNIKNNPKILAKFTIKKINHKNNNYEYFQISKTNNSHDNNLIISSALSYEDFLSLVINSSGVLTDSGGLTEETTYLSIPTITFRNNTERPETIKYGTNILIGDKFTKLLPLVNKIQKKNWKKSKNIPLWDGKTAERILKILNEMNE